MKKNLLLTCLIGAPISFVALWYSWMAFWIAFQSRETWWFAFLGIGGIWAVFTGIRNLLHFDTAHINLRWHDWIGGIFGFIANVLLCGGTVYSALKAPASSRFDHYLLIQLLIFIASSSALVCFTIVAWCFFRQRRSTS